MRTIELSQRNLLSLLHKLEMPGSAATIIKPTSEGSVRIVAIPDEVAYQDRQPGPMHPETERFVNEMKSFMALWKLRKTDGKSRMFAKIYGGKA